MSLRAQAGRFALVGGAATGVHLAVGGAAIALGAPPLLANPAAFAVAFAVSYLGHRGWTFAEARAPLRRSLPRFAGVALAGFALNEATLAALLALGVPPLPAFGAAVLGAAALTFLLGRLWAFRAA